MVSTSAPATTIAALDRIPFASLGVVTIGFSSNVLKGLTGFGYLVPTCEHEQILGVIFDSTSFPAQNQGRHDVTRLSVFMGGEHHKEMQSWSRYKMESVALATVQSHLGISATPDFVQSTWWTNAIPQYPVKFHALLKTIETDLQYALPALTLVGNSFYGVGLADCVHRSFVAASVFAKRYFQ
jgi:oxygen-dependent protoporphyrinogen oxidase